MPLRMHKDGVRVLDEWVKHRNPPETDRQLVTEALRTVANRQWQGRWYAYDDTSDATVKIIEPRPGLTVSVRLWDPDDPGQFTLVRIVDDQPAA